MFVFACQSYLPPLLSERQYSLLLVPHLVILDNEFVFVVTVGI